MRLIGYKESLKLLNKYKIKLIDSQLIRSEKDINSFKAYPAVIKAYSPSIVHKNKLGLVKTGILNEKELISSYKDMIKKLKKIKAKKHELILQTEIKGQEFIIGAKKDLVFGLVLIFGLGGIYTDFLNKTAIRICPVSQKIAIGMIKEINANLDKKITKDLADIIQKVSKLMGKEKIKEIDLNPVIVNEKNANIVDVRILL